MPSPFAGPDDNPSAGERVKRYARPMFTSTQKQHLVVAFRHLDVTLAEVLRQLGAPPGNSLFEPRRNDADPDARAQVASAIDDVRNTMRAFMTQHGLDPPAPGPGATHVARSRLDLAMVAASELAARYLRGYGDLATADAREIDVLASVLRDRIAAAVAVLPERSS